MKNNIPLNKQIENIPEEIKAKDREAYNNGEISLAELQDKWVADGLMTRGYSNTSEFNRVISKHGFKQQIHGFLADHPEHMKLWDDEKNSAEGLDPAKFTLGSGRQAWFKCPQGFHEPEKREIKKHVSGHLCSKCRDEATAIVTSTPKPGRSLADRYPLVAAEFEAGGNELKPSDVAAKSRMVATFTPSCGNSLHRPYKQVVHNRTGNEDRWIKSGHPGSWCPWCSNEMKSSLHGKVCEYISSLIPLESGADVLVNQMVLPDDPKLPEGTRQGNEIDFLSHDLGLAIEIHGHHHKYDPEGYTESKKKRAEALGFDFFVIWEKDWEIPEKREYLKEQLRVIVGFKVMAYLKKQARSVSGVFWNGSDSK